MTWRGRRIAVVGLGVSNLAVIRYLHRHGAHIVGFDLKERAALGKTASTLEKLQVELVLGPRYLDELVARLPWDGVFLTPGLPKDGPQLAVLRARNVPLHSEIGLFFSLCPAPIIGVTGSSGKTTTTTLIAEMLRGGPRPVYVGGNIGTPLLEQAEAIEPDAWVVLELSSFQLELLDRSPHGAVVTNVTPNHLDIHGTMDAYVAAKRRIYEFQRSGDWAVFNGDDPHTRAMAQAAPGHVLTFQEKGPATACVEQGYIVVEAPATVFTEPGGEGSPARGGGHRTMPTTRKLAICPVKDVALPGRHNVENVLAAAAVAVQCGIEPEKIRAVATSFRGVPHRLEFVAACDGVRYYNDSIATSPARAVAGLRAFDAPVVLIAGGYDKRLPFDELAAALPGRARAVVLVGATAQAIGEAIARHGAETGASVPPTHYASSFEDAVHAARRAAQPGDVVLLSPACASYDMFPNFEARGELFRTMVRDGCRGGRETAGSGAGSVGAGGL